MGHTQSPARALYVAPEVELQPIQAVPSEVDACDTAINLVETDRQKRIYQWSTVEADKYFIDVICCRNCTFGVSFLARAALSCNSANDMVR